MRHRVEHAAVTSDGQVARIAELGLIPVPQGRFLSEIGDGLLSALGPQRAELAYPMRSFLDAGVELPGSTDAPVVASSPLPSIHDMVNRRTASGAPIAPHEAVTPAEALRAYTIGSAHAVHEEGHARAACSPSSRAHRRALGGRDGLRRAGRPRRRSREDLLNGGVIERGGDRHL